MNAMAVLAAQESARMRGEDERKPSAWRVWREDQMRRGRRLALEFAEANGVELFELLAEDGNGRLGRAGELHDLRYQCWAMLRRETALSYPQIGRIFSGRNHSTIMAGVKKHRAKEAPQ